MTTDRHAAGGTRQDDADWGDEREVAVWGQVSARTLYPVIRWNFLAGAVFIAIDPSRYWPCALVFVAFAFGFTAWTGRAARRSGVDLGSAPKIISFKWVLQALAIGIALYLLDRFVFRLSGYGGWSGAAEVVAGAIIGQYLYDRFVAIWQRRRRLRAQQPAGLRGPDDQD